MIEARLVRPKKRRSPKHDLEVPRPFIKTAGGKARLLPELCKRLPVKFGRYHELFVGGGAFFWHLQGEGLLKGGAVLNDSNERLIRAYRGIRDNVENVIEMLQSYVTLHKLQGRAFFERMRGVPPESDALTASWLVYLNKTAYNGLYRENRKGQFNVSFGDYKNPAILDEQNLRACSRALQEVEIHSGDFDIATTLGTHFGEVAPGDLWYADPPYVPVSKTANFTGYTRDGFTQGDQRRLAQLAMALKREGVHVLLTNSDAPLVRELYPEPFWKVERVEVRGDALNTDGAKRGKVGELIIS